MPEIPHGKDPLEDMPAIKAMWITTHIKNLPLEWQAWVLGATAVSIGEIVGLTQQEVLTRAAMRPEQEAE